MSLKVAVKTGLKCHDHHPDRSGMKLKINKISLFVFSIGAIVSSEISAQGLSYKNLVSCEQDYSEILSPQSEMEVLDELPPGVYLARSVTQGFEKLGEKYFSHQILLEAKQSAPEVCFKGKPISELKSQAFIPTLIDRTPTHKWGHTFWSVSATLNKLTGAMHSKRSLIPQENYREALQTQGYKVASFQKTHNEFQLRLVRNISSWKETVVISYDQF
jgi:hypothetical protein